MIANMTTKGANWISMSDDPKAVAPLAWAKAGVMNKGYNSKAERSAPCRGLFKRAAYIAGRAVKAIARFGGVFRLQDRPSSPKYELT